MRAVVQRVSSASVTVEGEVVGRCGRGLLVLAAAHKDDTEADAVKLADRVYGLRIFNDAEGKMNLSLEDLGELPEPEILAISNFTLYGDALKSRRPSFVQSAGFDQGQMLFERFVSALRERYPRTQTGVFGAHMDVELVNDGPVTLVIDVPGMK